MNTQEAGIVLTSVTVDGDSAIHTIMEAQFGKDITINQDPNHYVKGLIKSFEHLTEDFPALADLGASLKTHFLLGTPAHL
jgi:hypothetical protein